MNKTIGVFAHVDAGKTTFCEQILYHTGVTRKQGRVDHGDTALDFHPLEKRRGITIFSDQAVFSYEGATYFLVDTPGHVDFSSEMERVLSIIDFAILLVSGVEGIQAHTETLWKLFEDYHIPVVIFINKTDREGADYQQVVAQLRQKLSENCLDFMQGPFTDEIVEELAQRDDELLEYYLDEEIIPEKWIPHVQRLLLERKIFPCFGGSALQDDGIEEFLRYFHDLTVTEYENLVQNEPAARVYKVRRDFQGNRMAYLKVTEGKLSVKDLLTYTNSKSGERISEKIDELYRCQGNRFFPVASVTAGELCAVKGLSLIRTGEMIGGGGAVISRRVRPLMGAKVLAPPELSVVEVLRCVRILEDEDPALEVQWNESLKEIQVKIMGPIQLEVLQEIVLERFGHRIFFGPCEILYQETIAAPVMGYGHFEPLKHYAEVHLLLTPGERGSGVTFESRCPLDILDRNYQNLIRTHVFEKKHVGVLTGSPLTDVKITLITGRAHLKHTEGGDFREAVYRAIRQGLEKAQSVLLEPMVRYRIEVPDDYLGKVLSDVQQRKGTFEAPELGEGAAVIAGKAPAATFLDYGVLVQAFTKGIGRVWTEFCGYESCHNTEEVIKFRAYNRREDRDNVSDSVFCAKGAGYHVPWNEVEQHLHCPVLSEIR